MKISNKELQQVIKLSAFDRYKYFMKRIADFEEIFSIQDPDGQWAISSIDKQGLFPVWSSHSFAELALTNEWRDYTIISFDLDEFNNSIIPFIDKNNLLISVFGIQDSSGFVVDIEEFTRDLDVELSNF